MAIVLGAALRDGAMRGAPSDKRSFTPSPLHPNAGFCQREARSVPHRSDGARRNQQAWGTERNAESPAHVVSSPAEDTPWQRTVSGVMNVAWPWQGTPMSSRVSARKVAAADVAPLGHHLRTRPGRNRCSALGAGNASSPFGVVTSSQPPGRRDPGKASEITRSVLGYVLQQIEHRGQRDIRNTKEVASPHTKRFLCGDTAAHRRSRVEIEVDDLRPRIEQPGESALGGGKLKDVGERQNARRMIDSHGTFLADL